MLDTLCWAETDVPCRFGGSENAVGDRVESQGGAMSLPRPSGLSLGRDQLGRRDEPCQSSFVTRPRPIGPRRTRL